jgi:hypothetical protein
MKQIEFLRESIIVLTKKIEILERWCAKHEAEGLGYGNEFEERKDKLNHDLADLGERINLIAQGILNIDKRVEAIEDFLVL